MGNWGDVAFLTIIIAHLQLIISPGLECLLLGVIVVPSLVDLVVEPGKLPHEKGKLPFIFLGGFIILLFFIA